MDLEGTVDFSRPFPVFPLRDSVQLPDTYLPLNIFEDRYRHMVTDALDRAGFIAMALYTQSPPAGTGRHGSTDIRPWLCISSLCQYEPLQDGRFLILLKGVCRARCIGEVKGRPYRRFRLAPPLRQASSANALAQHVQALRDSISDPALQHLESVAGLRRTIADTELTNEARIDMAIAALCADVEQRYAMLAQPNPVTRARWICYHVELLRRQTAWA